MVSDADVGMTPDIIITDEEPDTDPDEPVFTDEAEEFEEDA